MDDGTQQSRKLWNQMGVEIATHLGLVFKVYLLRIEIYRFREMTHMYSLYIQYKLLRVLVPKLIFACPTPQ